MAAKNVIHTQSIGGNLYNAARYINEKGWADYLVTMEFSGFSTIAVFRMPADLVPEE